MTGDDRQEAFDVVAQPLGRDRRVFDERQRLGIVPHGHRQPEARFTQAPDSRLRREVECVIVAVAETVSSQIAFECVESRREVFGAVGVELDAEERARVAVDETLSQCLERRALARVIENRLVHHLDRRRAMSKDERGGGQRFE